MLSLILEKCINFNTKNNIIISTTATNKICKQVIEMNIYFNNNLMTFYYFILFILMINFIINQKDLIYLYNSHIKLIIYFIYRENKEMKLFCVIGNVCL